MGVYLVDRNHRTAEHYWKCCPGTIVPESSASLRDQLRHVGILFANIKLHSGEKGILILLPRLVVCLCL